MLRGLTKEESLKWLDSWGQAIENDAVYGFGLSKMLYFRAPIFKIYDASFSLKGVFDNNPALWGQKIMGFNILSPEAIKNLPLDSKLVVLTSDYNNVREQLQAFGLKEKENFIKVSVFWSLWTYYKHAQRLTMWSMGLHITDRCSLACDYCAALIPKLTLKEGDRPLELLQEDMDLLFSMVNFVSVLYISGGEALMHKELPQFLDYLHDRHFHKCAAVCINTNGTMIPGKGILDRCAAYGVEIRISDYSEAGIPGYGRTFERLKKNLDDYGIVVSIADAPWYDFYLSDESRAALRESGPKGLMRHFAACPVQAAIFSDGFFYSCDKSYFIRKAGLIKNDMSIDALDFRALKPENQDDRLLTLMSILNYYASPALQACRFCAGCQGTSLYPPARAPRARQPRKA
ncbi:MAG: hypothetical protein LBS31_03560 [Candidatus Adiutrix sp.]|jgi:hypothetical protein|nr:hypothetical protein [Candidatus Adiutrix sp.]